MYDLGHTCRDNVRRCTEAAILLLKAGWSSLLSNSSSVFAGGTNEGAALGLRMATKGFRQVFRNGLKMK